MKNVKKHYIVVLSMLLLSSQLSIAQQLVQGMILPTTTFDTTTDPELMAVEELIKDYKQKLADKAALLTRVKTLKEENAQLVKENQHLKEREQILEKEIKILKKTIATLQDEALAAEEKQAKIEKLNQELQQTYKTLERENLAKDSLLVITNANNQLLLANNQVLKKDNQSLRELNRQIKQENAKLRSFNEMAMNKIDSLESIMPHLSTEDKEMYKEEIDKLRKAQKRIVNSMNHTLIYYLKHFRSRLKKFDLMDEFRDHYPSSFRGKELHLFQSLHIPVPVGSNPPDQIRLILRIVDTDDRRAIPQEKEFSVSLTEEQSLAGSGFYLYKANITFPVNSNRERNSITLRNGRPYYFEIINTINNDEDRLFYGDVRMGISH